MTTFVESCVETVAGSALAAERRSRGRPKARKLLRLLALKRNILITTHEHADPDGLASAVALQALLAEKLPQSKVSISVKGRVGGGLNEAFVRFTKLDIVPWNQRNLHQYDAIILVDAQPNFSYSPLPEEVRPLAVIDHHTSLGRRAKWPFCDIRKDVGATGSIIFSYFMETETPISHSLAATLLYGIETDLAGAAGSPTPLDNIALSSLTLLADTRRLYQMRYVDLPRDYYLAYAQGMQTAEVYGHVMVSHLQTIDSPEKPAVLADFLLRYDQVDSVLVSAVYGRRLVLSLRCSDERVSAADVMKKLTRKIGEGGGHRHKAGGYVPLEDNQEKMRAILLRRYLRAMGVKQATPQALV